MPLRTAICRKCDVKREVLLPQESMLCPSCGTERQLQAVERPARPVISTNVGLVKRTHTDYARALVGSRPFWNWSLDPDTGARIKVYTDPEKMTPADVDRMLEERGLEPMESLSPECEEIAGRVAEEAKYIREYARTHTPKELNQEMNARDMMDNAQRAAAAASGNAAESAFEEAAAWRSITLQDAREAAHESVDAARVADAAMRGDV